MINPIISEGSTQAQRENKTRHDWIGKLIDWELYKRSKFNYTTLYKQESIMENEMYKILKNFDIQTETLIPVSRSDLVIIIRKKEPAE